MNTRISINIGGSKNKFGLLYQYVIKSDIFRDIDFKMIDLNKIII